MKINIKDFDIQHKDSEIVDNKYYTLMDQQDFLDKDNNPCSNEESDVIYAKAILNKKPKHIADNKKYYSYYVMLNPKNELYNPVQIHSSIKAKSKFVDKVCKTEWFFKEVDKSVFDTYIDFLRTKNLRLLHKANRSLK
jgi:uncharacterized protein YbcV (DUF1398 family)